MIVVFEGRDAAGKGGTIKATTERVSPRVFRVVALTAPSDREKSQVHLQRYIQHFPAAGEEVSDAEQKRRFEARVADPLRQWKLSPMDLPSRSKWFEYSRARDQMLEASDTDYAPWYIVPSDDKRRARLNCISHLLSLIPYKKLPRKKVKLPARSMRGAYDDRKTLQGRNFVASTY